MIIPNANLIVIPNVCRRFVRKPMCAASPLFGADWSLIGLLGWLRKWKSAAAIAAASNQAT
jgi:hypothetical protein